MRGFVFHVFLLCFFALNGKCDFFHHAQKPLHAQFETAEHAYLGDQVTLQYPGYRINGQDFDFKIGSHRLSYGLIVALAGDYFGNWRLRGCPPQISDGYDEDPDACVRLFKEIAESMLEQGAEKVLDCITPPLDEMNGRICTAIRSGTDPAQAYRDISEEYDNRFGLCTHTGYLQLSLCNWDHFGQDAVNAYKAGHAAAIAISGKASENRNVSALQHAYFLEAYAQHYLTDLFSAGHLRTPRRLLHQSIESLNSLWPADKVNREMHGEESTAGLWVTNQLGEAWAVYGDKELSSAKSYKNVDQAVAAVQLGADEVWEAFQTGVQRSVDTYQALQKALDITRMRNLRNFTPLFAPGNGSVEVLQGRSNLSSRLTSSMVGYTQPELNQSRWEKILDAVKKSGPKASALPATVNGLLPEVQLDQYQVVNSTHLLVNQYGLLSTQNYPNRSLSFCNMEPEASKQRRSWTMLSQDYIRLPGLLAATEWNYVTAFEEEKAILLGTNREKTSNVYIGLQGKHVAWVQKRKENLSDTLSRAIRFGRFSEPLGSLGMIEERERPHSTEFKAHVFDGVFAQPRTISGSWTTLPSIVSFAYKFDVKSGSETHVSIGHDSGNQSLVWTLTSWTSDYATRQHFKIIEPRMPEPPQATLVEGNEIVRIFHGVSPNSTTFKLETLQLRLPDPAKPPFLATLSSQTFPITWNATSKYASFSFYRSMFDYSSRLVVLLEDADTAALSTPVFPRGSAHAFLEPIVSLVEVPDGVRSVTAPFLESVLVRRVAYTDRRARGRTTGALFQLLDNFGILGARLLAPDLDGEGFSYRVVGQVPAIAGQTSDAIGWIFKGV